MEEGRVGAEGRGEEEGGEGEEEVWGRGGWSWGLVGVVVEEGKAEEDVEPGIGVLDIALIICGGCDVTVGLTRSRCNLVGGRDLWLRLERNVGWCVEEVDFEEIARGRLSCLLELVRSAPHHFLGWYMQGPG